MDLYRQLPRDWQDALQEHTDFGALRRLEGFLEREAAEGRRVLPPAPLLFRAFELTPFRSVRVLILGQDPYHDERQACGLAFSVPDGVAAPPSLRNILKEYRSDLGRELPEEITSLEPWARRGALLINAILSVRAGEAGSHEGHGWEEFTDGVIRALNRRPGTVVFILWGRHAARKAGLVTSPWHGVVLSAHPSPLSAYRGFFGSRPFSKANALLEEHRTPPLDWSLA